jgi:DNA-binding MarR family transcriptional regulator
MIATPAKAAKPKPSRAPRKDVALSALSVEPAVEEEVIVAPALSNVVGYLLRRTHTAFQAYWMAQFHRPETPITPVQGGMLVVVSENPGLTQTELARIMNVEGPTLMQSIDRLEENGYVLRTRRPGDRRSNSLRLTPLGNRMLREIQAFLPVRDADLLCDFTPEERAEFVRMLTKALHRAHSRLKEIYAADAVKAQPAGQRRGKAR